jgi:hypothetical protein
VEVVIVILDVQVAQELVKLVVLEHVLVVLATVPQLVLVPASIKILNIKK